MKKRKYDTLDRRPLETTEDDDEGNEKISAGKLRRSRVLVPKHQAKMLWPIMHLKRLRNAYEQVMHRFAQYFIQLNNGNTFLFDKVSGFAP